MKINIRLRCNIISFFQMRSCIRAVHAVAVLALSFGSLPASAELQRLGMSLADGLDFTSTALGAGHDLLLRDRAEVLARSGAIEPVISNAGAGITELGVESASASVISAAGVVLRDRARVDGSVTSSGNIASGNQITISGAVTANTGTSFNRWQWTVDFPGSSGDVTLPPDTSQSLEPGSYSTVNVFSRARLRLHSGTYYMDQLLLEPQSVLELDTAGGPVFLYIRSNLIYRGLVEVSGPPDSLLVGYLGENSIAIEAPFNGTLVAPSAHVRLAVGATAHRGGVYARVIELDPDVAFTHSPFEFWDQIAFDVTPRFECVEERFDDKRVALFGYFNPNTKAVKVPVGEANRFSPDSQDRGQPTVFASGRHAGWFGVDVTSATTGWELNGATAVADGARICEAEVPAAALADTTVKAGAPRENFGSVVTLETGNDRYVLVQFDREAIKAELGVGRFVRNARLELTVVEMSPSEPVEALAMRRPWTEQGATWRCANDLAASASAEQCRRPDVWDLVRLDNTGQNPWHIVNALRPQGSVNGSVLAFDVSDDLSRFLGNDWGGEPVSWAIHAPDASGPVTFHAAEAGSALAPRLVIEPVSLADTDQIEPLSATVDTSILPDVDSLPDYTDGQPRPVAALVGPKGSQYNFVEGELIVASTDPTEVEAIRARWNATEMFRSAPLLPGYPTTYLLRVDTALADIDGLLPRLRLFDNRPRGEHRFSSVSALALMAIAAEERWRGYEVEINGISLPQSMSIEAFRDQSMTDGEDDPASILNVGPDPYQWPHFALHGVLPAWENLFFTQRLKRTIPVAVLDDGFHKDFIDIFSGIAFECPGGICENTRFLCGGSSCPWHGTDVAHAGFGVGDNEFAAAGPGGPVASVSLIRGTVSDVTSLSSPVGSGIRILSISSSLQVPAAFSMFRNGGGLNRLRDEGVLVFGAAANEDTDVDAEDCFIGICWEDTKWLPCEAEGVVCVGAVNYPSPGMTTGPQSRADYSNRGDDVDFYASESLTPVVGNVNGTHRLTAGTSVATPTIAGIAALAWAANPSVSAGRIEECLGRNPWPVRQGGRIPRADLAVACVGAGGAQVGPSAVEIILPEDGTEHQTGSPVRLLARADNLLGDPTGLISWRSDEDGFIGQSGSDQDLLWVPNTPGPKTIRAGVTNPNGSISEDSVRIVVAGAGQPVPLDIRIIEPPEDGVTVYAGLPHFFSAGSQSPLLDGPTCPDGISWSGTHSSVPTQGCTAMLVFPTAASLPFQGTTASFTASTGAIGSDTRAVQVVAADSLQVAITEPMPNLHGSIEVLDGDTVTFKAVTVGPDSPDSIEWLLAAGGDVAVDTASTLQRPIGLGSIEAPGPGANAIATLGEGDEIQWAADFDVPECERRRFQVIVRASVSPASVVGNTALAQRELIVLGSCLPD